MSEFNQLKTLIREIEKNGGRVQFCYPLIYFMGCDLDKLAQICKENPVDGYKAFIMPHRDGGQSHIMLKKTEESVIFI